MLKPPVIQWILFLAQRTVLFGIGAFSALLAKKAGDLKNSSIYLNQLMAFATISNTIMAAVMQTKTAKSVKSQAIKFFFDATVAMDETASGQGSLLSASSQCLLSYVGYEKTLWGCHLLDIVVAAVLMGLLSLVKDFRAALIAGINCFLPTIAADFGKYLVCYRVEQNELLCPFLPGNYVLIGAMQVLFGFILLMVVAAVLMGLLSLVKDFRAALIAGINCFLPTIAADFGKYLVYDHDIPGDQRAHPGALPKVRQQRRRQCSRLLLWRKEQIPFLHYLLKTVLSENSTGQEAEAVEHILSGK
ncbi:hypothetical protein AK812_SmicGene25566 [Symbiodinium microadriaticum]|uniref:Uncharacterized protein n=1 Tax=Symbiodinium microadriaticum TaxID=2951 RepID=A0A1Q9DBR2_SYMMI|nr:hypothetical protein AK812_SmicGene25566 [Symbiodinium microadriaticum]